MKKRGIVITCLIITVIIVGIISIVSIMNKSDSNGNVENSNINGITKFEADIYVFTKEEGGRNTPIYDFYTPRLEFEDTNVQVKKIYLPKDTQRIMPGSEASIIIELNEPVKMKVGTEFTLIEGGRTAVKGIVTKIY